MLHRAELARSQQIGSIVEATTWHWSQTLVALGARCATATTLGICFAARGAGSDQLRWTWHSKTFSNHTLTTVFMCSASQGVPRGVPCVSWTATTALPTGYCLRGAEGGGFCIGHLWECGALKFVSFDVTLLDIATAFAPADSLYDLLTESTVASIGAPASSPELCRTGAD